ncbi:MAG: pilus assembly protein TadG [Porphyrobacter sp.]|nr:pilus assembly protein TadG [Porphyrobacter sp.]
MRHFLKASSKMVADRSGAVLPMAAVGMLVAALIVGAAVDLSRRYKVENQLQAACDSAVLAGRRTVTTAGFDQKSKDTAKAYFDANFDDASQEAIGTAFDSDSKDDGQTVKGAATTTVDTLIMRLFGYDSFAVAVSCTSSMGMGNADVMLVLDTTGSMANSLDRTTRIAALRSAVKNFYKTVSTATKETNARVRYGFVPYSSTVNVGRLLTGLDANYIVDKWKYQSRQAFFVDYSAGTKSTGSTSYQNASVSNLRQYSSTRYSSNSNCTKALPSAGSYSSNGSVSQSWTTSGTAPNQTIVVTDSQPVKRTIYQCQGSGSSYYIYSGTETSDGKTSTTYTKSKWVNAPTSKSDFIYLEYTQVERPTNVFKTFASTTTYTGDNGAAQTSTWGGCIIERDTVNSGTFSYSSVTGISPSGALDVDIDSAPTSDDKTKWRPLWPEISYRRAGSNSSTYTQSATATGALGGTYCPVEARALNEMSQNDFNAYADSLTAVGGTYLDIGMIWGGRMLSPSGIFQDTVNVKPKNGGEVSRHIIFMTDGEMDTSNYVPQAWGMEWWDRKVTSDGSKSQEDARHTQRFRAVCEAVKAKGIRVWVIAFTSKLSDDLKACASDDSSYLAGNSSELDNAFQEIAKQVGELRITQ